MTITFEKLKLICVDPEESEKFRKEYMGQTIELYINKGQSKKVDRDEMILIMVDEGIPRERLAKRFEMSRQGIDKIINKMRRK